MLDLIYQRCFMPLYRKICFPSALFTKHLVLLGAHTMTAFSPLSLSSMLGILFDVLNIFVKQHGDAYRRIRWVEPMKNEV